MTVEKFVVRSILFAFLVSNTLLVGCSSSQSGSGAGPSAAPLAHGGASTVYVLQQTAPNQPSILGLSATATGNVTPTILSGVISASSYFEVSGLGSDSTGQLYMGGYIPDGLPLVEAFSPTGTGGQTFPRQFSPSPLTMPLFAMTTDPAMQLYIAAANGISVYPPTANVTDSLALRIVTMPSQQLPVGVAVDNAGNIYAACRPTGANPSSGSIFVFAAGASGAATPLRTITSDFLFSGVAVDAAGNIFAVENSEATASNLPNTEKLVEFAASASGAATPIKTISGGATGMVYGGAVRVDSAGNIYVVNLPVPNATSSSVTTPSILTFGPTASGNEPPAGNITSTAWTIPGSQLTLNE